MIRIIFLGGAAVLSVLGCLAPGVAAQDVCPNGRFGQIDVERMDVFDTPDDTDESRPGLLLRVGNAVHFLTTESFVRRELLFEEGDCFDPFLLSESERVLRSRPIIKEAWITSEAQADGAQRVRVRTQDDWSLAISLGISFDEGFRFEGLGVTERNLFGRGVTVGVTRSVDREFREFGGELGAIRLAGTPFQVSASAGETRVGPFLDQRAEKPYVTELGRFAVRQEVSLREDYFAYSVGEAPSISHVVLTFDRQAYALTGMYRSGVPGGLLLLGAGVARQVLEYPGGLAALETVNDEFDSPGPASDAERDAIRSQTDPLAATRFNALVGFRRVRFAVRERLDGVRAVQDVQLGTEGILTVGRSLGFLGTDSDANDLHARFDLFAGIAPGPLVLSGNAFLEGRRGMGSGADAGEWRDVMAQVDARAYWQPEVLGGHTVFARLKAAGAWSMDRPFQLTGGGREGVRGYSRDAFPGGRRLLATLEDRTVLLTRTALDVGLALFGDVGKIWPGDVPYGVDSGWRSSVGIGLRVSAPGGAIKAIRFDLTLPTSGDRDSQGVYFRFYTELGALLRTIDRRGQVERSRWSGIDGDLTLRPPS